MPTTGLGFRYPAGSDPFDVAQDIQNLATDLNTFLTGKYSLIQIVNINTGTTSYTPNARATGLYVECVGGGGAGGGCVTGATNGAAGGGGAGGGYAALWTTTIKTYTVAVGAGGAGVSGASGSVGGSTTFDSPAICQADGGNGGSFSTVAAGPVVGGAGGAGGAGSVGDIRSNGTAGCWGVVLAAAQVASGLGGASFFGSGSQGRVNATAGGFASAGYGGGGSGAAIISGGATQTGGGGSNGLIRVWEFGST